jgi:hypothetical protein
MKTIFIVQGYDKEIEGGGLEKVVTFEVFSKTEKEAITKSKKYLKKPFYRVSTVIEK